ncbi:LTA synthase family protein [Marinilabilia salmonicolor]|uniref:Phosphoglycerol transferase MdoB-like AlkP superfamily enzyme n=1 Tax=Marinilabilia salmonicolor TaxID=989 RepID=A0A368VC39_9BACT|nr:alkaline phosphatase family protein [Marinilabilia salmonicolor]RCW38696.1 phosphoglycerol transferase MdoB-like AlkP superfamily enzyme [Marinilabilia salmonicolor]
MHRSWSLNEFLVLIIRFLFILTLFSISRLTFFWFNADLFREISFNGFLNLLVGGLRFDISALLYVNSLFLLLSLLPFKFKFSNWYQKGLKILFLVTNGIALAGNVADTIYYRFTLKRTTAGVFEQFSNEENMGALWLRFIFDYWYATLIWVAFMFLLGYLYNRVKPQPALKTFGWKYLGITVVVMAVVGGLSIGGMRGGFRHSTRPINISNAAKYVERPEQVSIVLNTPFSIFRTFGKTVFKPVRFFEEEELSKIYTPVFQPEQSASGSRVGEKYPNVVLIILESFGREHIGALNQNLENGNYEGFTPFLDSLITQSWAFDKAYANGRKSIDALPSVIASVPSLVQPYIVSEYSTNKINGLAGLLSRVGYETAFYHGAPNGSMGFHAFTKMAGYDAYKGKTEYNNDEDFDGMWGIWDEPFFQFFAEDMGQLKEPFFTTLFSVSSHHPFAVPEQYVDTFPKGPLPLHEVMGYSDMALRRFFETASRADWFENTLFIITADHCTIPFHEEYKTPVESFAIPLVFYKPGDISPRMDSGLAQQTDIMPTVLSYIDYPYPYVAFGNDLLSKSREERFVVNYINDRYQFLYNNYAIYFDGEEVTEVYDLKSDPLQEINIKQGADLKNAKRLFKAYLQQYISRMINDEMSLK